MKEQPLICKLIFKGKEGIEEVAKVIDEDKEGEFDVHVPTLIKLTKKEE